MKLLFPDDYFRAEERDGFYINEMMKRYWACCLDLVRIVDETCKKYGLKYFADWGTLLGAARHNGFIPWDDDIDIRLKRPDYEKLMKVLPKEMPEKYRLTNCYSNENHKQFFAGFSDGHQIELAQEVVNNHYGCPFVATIDIYPMDYLPRDEGEREIVRDLFVIIWSTVEKIMREEDPEIIEDSVVQIEELCGVTFDRSKPLRSQLWNIANMLVMSYTEEDGDYLTEWCSYINRKVPYLLEKSWFDEPKYLPFENIQMPVPSEYEKNLDLMYGDWKVPKQVRAGHDYPAFKDQMEFLKQKLAEMKAEKGE